MDPLAICCRMPLIGTALVALAGCTPGPPSIEEIRQAYAAHVHVDPVHERGMQAKARPVVIPNQGPDCTHDGRSHFDCRIRVIFETDAGRHSQAQLVHIRHDNASWIIDSVN